MEDTSPLPRAVAPATSLTSEVIGHNDSTDSSELKDTLSQYHFLSPLSYTSAVSLRLRFLTRIQKFASCLLDDCTITFLVDMLKLIILLPRYSVVLITITPYQDSVAGESISTEWTDEKHSLYLKSMEASFVNQLYNSFNSLGRSSQEEHSSDAKFSRQTRVSSGQQFKVLRGGCWEKINFGRDGHQLEKADGSRVLLANPWIRHFRSASRHQVATSSGLQGKPAFENRAICLKGKIALPSSLAANSKQFHASHLYSHNSVDSNAEVSDQNFVGDNIEGDKESCACSPKRLKTAVDTTSSNDQVVPFSMFPVTLDVNKNPVYVESERHRGGGL